MYCPDTFTAKDPEYAWDLIRAYPFASLISLDDEGFPFVTPLPLHLAKRGQQQILLGHCTQPNPHWRYLQARPSALVTFMGPHAYMSPSVYTDVARVPTWNYLAVHCQVEAQLIKNLDDKDALLKHLIGDHEPAYAAQWRALPDAFQQKMMDAIVAFELTVTDVQCKIKLNQHRPEAHAAMHATYAAGNDHEKALASWLVKLGLV